jgi:hypothetical protein
MVPTLQDGG